MITASDWRPLERNTLAGFVTLHLSPSGLSLRGCSFHRKDGVEWIALPSRPRLDSFGVQQKDSAGKALYQPVVEILDATARKRFQAAAVAAVRALIGDGHTAPPPAPPPRRHRPGLYQKPSQSRIVPDDAVDDLWRGAP